MPPSAVSLIIVQLDRMEEKIDTLDRRVQAIETADAVAVAVADKKEQKRTSWKSNVAFIAGLTTAIITVVIKLVEIIISNIH